MKESLFKVNEELHTMRITVDVDRAHIIGPILYSKFNTNGIFGRTSMPEDELPRGVRRGSLQHILFLTFTVSIAYQGDANELWDTARKVYETEDTYYLFDPLLLNSTPFEKIKEDMQRTGLSKKFNGDPKVWLRIGESLLMKWKGDPRIFLESCDYSAPVILERLRNDKHKGKHDFPSLRGLKIGPLWLRMLRDNANLSSIQDLDKVPIPVDLHVARASFSLGVIKSEYMEIDGIFPEIRRVWASGVKGHIINGKEMIALDIDEPLWHLSKYGCSSRDKESGNCSMAKECPVVEWCVYT